MATLGAVHINIIDIYIGIFIHYNITNNKGSLTNNNTSFYKWNGIILLYQGGHDVELSMVGCDVLECSLDLGWLCVELFSGRIVEGWFTLTYIGLGHSDINKPNKRNALGITGNIRNINK